MLKLKKSWFLVAAAVPLVLVASIGVWKVSGNDARTVGALGPLEEPVPLSWRGEWSERFEYAGGEVVSYQGVSYVAETANSAQEPGSSDCRGDCPWSALGQAGSGGTAGPAGPPGPPGPKGDTGNPGPGGQGSCIGETVTLQGGTNGANVSATGMNYSSLIAQLNPTGSSTNGTVTVLCGGRLSNFAVTGSPANVQGSRYGFTVRVNGNAALGCTVPSQGTIATCRDTVNSIVLSPGDKVIVSVYPSPGATDRCRRRGPRPTPERAVQACNAAGTGRRVRAPWRFPPPLAFP